MSAKEYAKAIREELYRQNKSVLEVTDDLWLAISDNIEKFAEQAVEEYKSKVIERLKAIEKETLIKTEELYKDLNLSPAAIFAGSNSTLVTIAKCIEIVKSGGVADE